MREMSYVNHPIIEPETIEARVYQQVIFDSARKGNTLVVLPTGLGKTEVAIMLAAHKLSEDEVSKILMMAPTRPLATQHEETFKKTLTISEEKIRTLTGRTRPEKREKEWSKGQIFFATPQTVERDMISGKFSPNEFSLLVFDEAHRAVGDYPYSFIAERYEDSREDSLILALTASPGSSSEKIEKVKQNLHIQQVEARTEDHPNVEEYVQTTDVERRMLEFPEPLAKMKKFLEKQLKQHLKNLKDMDFLDSIQNVGKKELLSVKKKINRERKQKSPNPPRKCFKGMMDQASAFRLSHCIELLESQGLSSLKKYLDRMEKKANKSGASKSLRILMDSPNVEKVKNLVDSTAGRIDNPKLQEAKKIIKEQFSEKPQSKIILFAHYRDSIDQLYQELQQVDEVEPAKFIGQSDRKNEDGMSQKNQKETIRQFREGRYNTLISTAVGEEGLDIPSVDLALFYEPVPSEIRSIQRRGRTGRQKPGKVIVLIMKGTRDESFYWAAFHKEKKMRETLKEISKNDDNDNQKSIKEYGDG